MIRIIQNAKGFEGKVNFVDDNNVFVGYELEGQCCENFGWFISSKEETDIDMINDKFICINISHQCAGGTSIIIKLEGYVFDAGYFTEKSYSYTKKNCCYDNDFVNVVRFKMIKNKKWFCPEVLFLHLYNCHNGYYSHGFLMKNGNNILQDRSI